MQAAIQNIKNMKPMTINIEIRCNRINYMLKS